MHAGSRVYEQAFHGALKMSDVTQILPLGSAEPQEALWLFGADPIQALRYE